MIFLIFFSVITYRKSFGTGIISGAFILTLILAISLSKIKYFPLGIALVETEWIGSSIILIIIAVGTLSIALSMARAIDMIGVFALVLLSIVFFGGVSFIAVASPSSLPIVGIVVIGLFALGYFVNKRSFRHETIDSWLRQFAIDFLYFGETSFYKANLTDADFTDAILKNTNFNRAILIRTCFKDTVKLNIAKVGKTILADPTIRNLLINPSNGDSINLFKANLRGANLNEANLQYANLKQADLSQASLQYANLGDANLTEVNAVETDFSNAYLTGVCLENWNINSTTRLDHIDCQYIYLLNNQKERRPSSGEFKPEEFTKLFEEVFDTVDLIFSNGIDWKAFIETMKTVQVQNEDIPLEVSSIENKGDGIFVVKVKLPPDKDKEKIHQYFQEIYQHKLEAVEAKYKAMLKARNAEINIYRQQSIDIMELVKIMANRPISLEAKAITNSSPINIRDISNDNAVIQQANENTIKIGKEIIKEKMLNYEYIQRFLEQAGAINKGDSLIEVTDITGKLSSYTPFYVMFLETPKESDISDFKKVSENLKNNQSEKIAILAYENLQDTICKMEIAKLRLQSNFIVIPIPLASIKEALIKSTSPGLLAEYVERYLQGADFLKDRNAIGDTLCFYGRHHFLNALEQDLSRCQGIALLGIRKSGKTSVLLQLKLSMQKHPIIHIDLQPYGGYSYGVKLFNEILKQLQDLLNKSSPDNNFVVELFDVNSLAKEITDQFIEKFCKLAQMLEENNYNIPVVCFLDEIDRIFPTESDPVEKVEEFNAFFGALRQLSQTQKKLSLLVADVHPDFNRVNIWTQWNVPTNPVFQFFKEIHIQPFALQETKTMLTEIGKFMGVEFEPEILDIIHQESGGHPFIARQIASMIYHKAEKQEKEENNLLKLITNSSSEPYLKRILKYSDSLKIYFQQNIWDDLNKRDFTTAMAILRLLACNNTLTEPIIEEALLTRLNGQWRTSQFCILAFLRGAERLAICLLEGMVLQKWDAPEQYFTSDCESALLWLENAGLIKQNQSEQEISHSLQVELMSSWLKRQMKKDERKKWSIPSRTLE
ncbi:pentapeptide repeat-containing protein [Crocosphaera sp. Alani8]|uniref:pentapeptide repeat-containing protein n=1 Tax=Crocosphaera sp. Alani8 TaxID=3038952 RepID=UPI00313F30D0